MSNKIIEKDLATTAKNVRETAGKLHARAINTTDTVVEETLAAGEEWQNVMDKAMKAGVDIFAKQQDLTLTTLEAVKAQYLSGNDRLVKLLGLNDFNFNQWTNTFFNRAKKASATAANKVNKRILKAEEKVKSEAIKESVEQNKIEAVPTVSTVAKKAAKTVEVAAKEGAKAVKKTAKATTKAAKKTATKSTAKAVKKTKKAAAETTTAAKNVAATATVKAAEKVEKVAATTVATANVAAPKTTTDKLTVIEGIGPKVQEVLNNAGILTYQQLSLKTAAELETILVEANPRYKRFVPTTWAAQAKFAAEGKMEELTAWQDELKGGKIVK